MKKHFVYCHGYGSSANTPKVDILRKYGNCDAFDINIDPSISIPELCDKIDLLIASDPHDPSELIFVGTSLGAWFAAYLARLYSCRAILINPSVEPSISLEKYGVPEDIRSKYSFISSPRGEDSFEYHFSIDDPVIDSMGYREGLEIFGIPYKMYVDNHRFEKNFEKVIAEHE